MNYPEIPCFTDRHLLAAHYASSNSQDENHLKSLNEEILSRGPRFERFKKAFESARITIISLLVLWQSITVFFLVYDLYCYFRYDLLVISPYLHIAFIAINGLACIGLIKDRRWGSWLTVLNLAFQILNIVSIPLIYTYATPLSYFISIGASTVPQIIPDAIQGSLIFSFQYDGSRYRPLYWLNLLPIGLLFIFYFARIPKPSKEGTYKTKSYFSIYQKIRHWPEGNKEDRYSEYFKGQHLFNKKLRFVSTTAFIVVLIGIWQWGNLNENLELKDYLVADDVDKYTESFQMGGYRNFNEGHIRDAIKNDANLILEHILSRPYITKSEQYSALHELVSKNKNDWAWALIDQYNLDLNYLPSKYGVNLTSIAAKFGNLEFLKWLIEEKKVTLALSSRFKTPINQSEVYAAMEHRQVKILEYLLSIMSEEEIQKVRYDSSIMRSFNYKRDVYLNYSSQLMRLVNRNYNHYQLRYKHKRYNYNEYYFKYNQKQDTYMLKLLDKAGLSISDRWSLTFANDPIVYNIIDFSTVNFTNIDHWADEIPFTFGLIIRGGGDNLPQIKSFVHRGLDICQKNKDGHSLDELIDLYIGYIDDPDNHSSGNRSGFIAIKHYYNSMCN